MKEIKPENKYTNDLIHRTIEEFKIELAKHKGSPLKEVIKKLSHIIENVFNRMEKS